MWTKDFGLQVEILQLHLYRLAIFLIHKVDGVENNNHHKMKG